MTVVAPPLRVSVVVATYAPGKKLDRVIDSLDAQTMPASEFEVIFVDDGSPDDTWARLERMRQTHDNVRTERIENTGWPSRPRNVGLEMARGEYVVFMDHDDELYPRALEAAYAMAWRTRADVVNGKETRTDQSKWALEVYTGNADNVVDRDDLHPLLPTNPHKLFRRQLLMDHGIRFPEGRRVMWEDVFFALHVARHAEVVSVMSEPPFYHWVRGHETASSTYGSDPREFWGWLREIVLQTELVLAGPDLARQRRLMLAYQYRFRILGSLNRALFRAPVDVQDDVRRVAEDLITHIPTDLDDDLGPVLRGRAALVRAGRWDLLTRLVEVDADVVGVSTVTSAHWVDGTLEITVESRWTNDGGPLTLRREHGGVVRDLAGDLCAVLPREALEMTAALAAARTTIGLRSRTTAVNWMIPGTSVSRVDTTGSVPELVVSATAVLDPNTVVFGHPLEDPSWDMTARNEVADLLTQRRLRSRPMSLCAVANGHVYVAYRNRAGMLSLDIDQTHRSLTATAPLDVDRARIAAPSPVGPRWRRGPRRYVNAFAIPFTGVATNDDSVILGEIVNADGAVSPARMVSRADGLWLEAHVDLPLGRHPLSLRFHGRTMPTAVQIVVDERGRLTLTGVE